MVAGGAVKAPMPGKVLSVNVKAGDRVTKGQTLVVLEAMKMEQSLTAPRDGVVEAANVEPVLRTARKMRTSDQL